MTLRPYQQHTINLLYEWFRTNDTGDPCIVLPTAAGKSVVIAALIHDALKNYPATRVLMLTHVRELIEQNAEKLRAMWPNAPIGIYSAGIGRKEIDQVTFGGIQSLRGKSDIVGHVDLLLVDEAHLISHRDEGSYRTIIRKLREINPRLRVVGLTATPFRLGHGKITDGEALFSDLIEPVTIRELVYGGYLSPLVSRATHARYDVAGIHKRGGEFIEKELQERVDTQSQNAAVAREIVNLAGERRAWLVFCTGVGHAYHIRDQLRELDIPTETVTGKTPKTERDEILRRYRAGEIRALTNANVLTTGFDYPDIDLIALLRPTMSAGLYMQMVGRGFRLKTHTDHCLVLDFAGVIAQHGPITAVEPESGSAATDDSESDKIPPGKECPACHWIIPAAMRACPNPECDHVFPAETKDLKLRDDDIMGDEGMCLDVRYWVWEQKVSRSGNDMLVASYYGEYSDAILREYLLLWTEGFAGQKSMKAFKEIASGCGANLSRARGGDDVIAVMNECLPPKKVRWEQDGKYRRVIAREW